MPRHEYTPKEALTLLLKLLEPTSADLAQRIRVAIDAGKDVHVEEPLTVGRGRRPRKRYYRQNQPYSDEEAIDVAMTVLHAHFVETRVLVHSAHLEFKKVGLAGPKPLDVADSTETEAQAPVSFEIEATEEMPDVMAKDEYKAIEIEAESETVQEKKNLPDIHLDSISDQQLGELRDIFVRLRALVNVKEYRNGNAH
jgi:hypothetical protein